MAQTCAPKHHPRTSFRWFLVWSDAASGQRPKLEHPSQGFMLRTPSITASKRCLKNPMQLGARRHQRTCFVADLTQVAKATQDRPCPKGTCGKTPGGCPCNQCLDCLDQNPQSSEVESCSRVLEARSRSRTSGVFQCSARHSRGGECSAFLRGGLENSPQHADCTTMH